MAIANHEYQSEFARRHYGQDKAEGKADQLVLQVTRRFGPLPDEVQERLASTTFGELDAIGEHLVTAQNLDEVLESR